MSDAQPNQTPHVPLVLVWMMISALAVFSFWLGGQISQIDAEIRVLKEWRTTAQSSRFTDRDAQSMRTELMAEIRDERAFSRAVCNELRRLTEELEKIPANDCSR